MGTDLKDMRWRRRFKDYDINSILLMPLITLNSFYCNHKIIKYLLLHF